jgi:hypothetical protein
MLSRDMAVGREGYAGLRIQGYAGLGYWHPAKFRPSKTINVMPQIFMLNI